MSYFFKAPSGGGGGAWTDDATQAASNSNLGSIGNTNYFSSDLTLPAGTLTKLRGYFVFSYGTVSVKIGLHSGSTKVAEATVGPITSTGTYEATFAGVSLAGGSYRIGAVGDDNGVSIGSKSAGSGVVVGATGVFTVPSGAPPSDIGSNGEDICLGAFVS